MKSIAIYTILALAVAGCNNNASNRNETSAIDTAAYLKRGDSLTKITFDTLRNTLTKTIAEKGLPQAIRFCNTEALPITSTYASKGIQISRVTDKTRNPVNAFSGPDQLQWETYNRSGIQPDSLRSTIVVAGDTIHYYKPIILQSLCLNCHGTPEKKIVKPVLHVIDSLYPYDNAKNYSVGELRGMWHVVFPK